uniref:Uncharacterized protein n=1 Tax=Arundo donax TaxID=35708 RepID=A0A0A9F6Z5_ARUDO
MIPPDVTWKTCCWSRETTSAHQIISNLCHLKLSVTAVSSMYN